MTSMKKMMMTGLSTAVLIAMAYSASAADFNVHFTFNEHSSPAHVNCTTTDPIIHNAAKQACSTTPVAATLKVVDSATPTPAAYQCYVTATCETK